MTVIDHQLAGQIVSRETLAALRDLEALVRRWTPAVNLISKSTVPDLWDRHIADSAQLFSFCPEAAKDWLDIGSGGGFPGLVIAILAKEARPQLKVTMVESDARKSTFLRQAAVALGLKVDVITDRVESLSTRSAEVLSARALAPLTDLLSFAAMHLGPEGIAVFPKGARHADEVAAAQRNWTFDLESHSSRSDPDAAILIIRNIERAQQD